MQTRSDGGTMCTLTVTSDELHRQACERGDLTYSDPQTGYLVFTALALQRRGSCCGNGCRHCPFEHQAVSAEKRAQLQRELARRDDGETGAQSAPAIATSLKVAIG